ncbi:MAG: xanthine phosphoribosyltransferase [Eubacteriales bacterium]
MESLKQRILKDGRGIGREILKVDSFLNHQLDVELLNEIGKEFYDRFKDENINKILTIEASGIALAVITAQYFHVPVVFAKKKEPSTMDEGSYIAQIHSFTKGIDYSAVVSKKYLDANDRVLIIDDFLARGGALRGLCDILDQAHSKLAGIGIVIEKEFQGGGRELREKGIKLESLAVIKSIEDNNIIFC